MVVSRHDGGDTHDLDADADTARSPAVHYFVNGGGGAYMSFGTSLAWPTPATQLGVLSESRRGDREDRSAHAVVETARVVVDPGVRRVAVHGRVVVGRVRLQRRPVLPELPRGERRAIGEPGAHHPLRRARPADVERCRRPTAYPRVTGIWSNGCSRWPARPCRSAELASKLCVSLPRPALDPDATNAIGPGRSISTCCLEGRRRRTKARKARVKRPPPSRRPPPRTAEAADRPAQRAATNRGFVQRARMPRKVGGSGVSSGAIRDVRHLRRGCGSTSAVPSNRSDFRTKTAVRMMPSPRRSAASAAHPPAASRAARQSPG